MTPSSVLVMVRPLTTRAQLPLSLTPLVPPTSSLCRVPPCSWSAEDSMTPSSVLLLCPVPQGSHRPLHRTPWEGPPTYVPYSRIARCSNDPLPSSLWPTHWRGQVALLCGAGPA